MIPNRKNLLVLFSVLACLLFSALSQARLYAIDHMNLATVFLYDGEFDKAVAELKQVNQKDHSFDLSRFQSIDGLIALRRGDFADSVIKLDRAIRSTMIKKFDFDRNIDQEQVRRKEIEQLNVYLAEAHFHLQDCQQVIDALDAAGDFAYSRVQLYAVRADCNWRTGYHGDAVSVLADGYRKFPDAINLMKQQFRYFIEGGLYTSAAEMAVEFLKEDDLSDADYLSFAKAFEGAGQDERALSLLQEARGKYPDNAQFPLFEGHVYLKREQLHIAAGLFEQAAQIDNEYLVEAAEVYRRAGHFPTALRLIAQVPDAKRQLIQKVAIYIELEEFERVVALQSDINRQGLLADQNVRYALAYAYFRLRDFGLAEKHLSEISSNDLFEKSIAVRQSIARCREDISTCE